MRYLGQLLTQQDIYSPPAYYNRMVYDPTQPPVQMGWGGGAGGGAMGPWPGFMIGQRIITQEEADRIARERATFAARRAEVSDNPAHKYLAPQGRLQPKFAKALRAEQASRRKTKTAQDPVKQLQKRILTTVLIGAIISALLN